MQDGYEVTHTGETPDIRVVRRSRTELVDRVSRLHVEYHVQTVDGRRCAPPLMLDVDRFSIDRRPAGDRP